VAANESSGNYLGIGECEYSGTQLCYSISQLARNIHISVTGMDCTCISSMAGFADGIFASANSVVQN